MPLVSDPLPKRACTYSSRRVASWASWKQDYPRGVGSGYAFMTPIGGDDHSFGWPKASFRTMHITGRPGKIFEVHGRLLSGRKRTKAGISRGKEDLLTMTTTEPGSCQVRSGTKSPCLSSAAVKIRGVPFCEPCAREQEAYFTLGELTEAPGLLLLDERLVGMLSQRCRSLVRHRVVDDREPNAA